MNFPIKFPYKTQSLFVLKQGIIPEKFFIIEYSNEKILEEFKQQVENRNKGLDEKAKLEQALLLKNIYEQLIKAFSYFHKIEINFECFILYLSQYGKPFDYYLETKLTSLELQKLDDDHYPF